MMNSYGSVMGDRRRSRVRQLLCGKQRSEVVSTAGAYTSGAYTEEQMEWAVLRAAIVKALEDFPEARAAVVRAMKELGKMDEGRTGK
ncbi:MAG: hypothetical protein ABJF23_25445 [Bryobacteraceae bacterium]